jgi:hypothetical protein
MGSFTNNNVEKWHEHKEVHDSTYNEVGVCEQCLAELNTFEELFLVNYSKRVHDETRDDTLRFVASLLRDRGDDDGSALIQSLRYDFLKTEGRI